eukprot:scaffold22147_cov107-Skeletonema_marinoi.AAC.5
MSIIDAASAGDSGRPVLLLSTTACPPKKPHRFAFKSIQINSKPKARRLLSWGVAFVVMWIEGI